MVSSVFVVLRAGSSLTYLLTYLLANLREGEQALLPQHCLLLLAQLAWVGLGLGLGLGSGFGFGLGFGLGLGSGLELEFGLGLRLGLGLLAVGEADEEVDELVDNAVGQTVLLEEERAWSG